MIHGTASADAGIHQPPAPPIEPPQHAGVSIRPSRNFPGEC